MLLLPGPRLSVAVFTALAFNLQHVAFRRPVLEALLTSRPVLGPGNRAITSILRRSMAKEGVPPPARRECMALDQKLLCLSHSDDDPDDRDLWATAPKDVHVCHALYLGGATTPGHPLTLPRDFPWPLRPPAERPRRSARLAAGRA